MLNRFKSGIIAGQFYNIIANVSTNKTNLNVYDYAKSLGWNGVERLRMYLTINSGINISSNDPTLPAMVISSFRDTAYDDYVTIVNNGNIYGAGGAKGAGGTKTTSYKGNNGGSGGTAIQITTKCDIINSGNIFGGGGGGGGAGGTDTAATYSIEQCGCTCNASGSDCNYAIFDWDSGRCGHIIWPVCPGNTPGCAGQSTCTYTTYNQTTLVTAASTSNGSDGTEGNADTGTGTTKDGKGGALGYPGDPGKDNSYTGGNGGAAGNYVDGSSYIQNFSVLIKTSVKGNYV